MGKPTIVRRLSSAAGTTTSVQLSPPLYTYIPERTTPERMPKTRIPPFSRPNLIYRDKQPVTSGSDRASRSSEQHISLPKKVKAFGKPSALAEDRPPKLSRRSDFVRASKYGEISDLRASLGLDGRADSRNITLVAIDTESERHGLENRIVEVGVTTLDTREIQGVDPGRHAERWMRHARHHHVVVDITRFPTQRMHSHLFGESLFLSAPAADAVLKSIWSSLGPNVAIVGHGVLRDVHALSTNPELQMIIPSASFEFPSEVDKLYDTFMLATDAQSRGLQLPSLQLGQILRRLGPGSQHASDQTMKGCHNAGNDAAYAMMAALLLAVRYDPATGHYLDDNRKTTNKRGLDFLTHLFLPWLSRLFRELNHGFQRQMVMKN